MKQELMARSPKALNSGMKMRLARSAGKNSPKVGLSRIRSNPQLKSVQQDFESESHALLTVTILEANLKVDLSSFLQKM